MNRFRQVFSNRHVILPVIHVTGTEQAVANTEIVFTAGADGVFLINHGFSADKLLRVHEQVHAAFPGRWIGVNCLGLAPEEVFGQLSSKVAGIWVDNAGILEDSDAQPEAERIRTAQRQSGWQELYFGGVAFKYQRPVSDLARASRNAAAYVDVVTTSGPGTGKAASPEKIRAMKEALADFPLAIASGITPENVEEYLPWADCFLVATGISKTFDQLDPQRVRALVERVRSYSVHR